MSKDYYLPHTDLNTLVPQNLRNPMLTSLIDNLFNRFMTQDEAVPLFGYVGRKPSSLDDVTPKVPQMNKERDINSLIPVLSFKVGAETFSFTVQDLIKKAKVLGISDKLNTWLYSQGNNFAPPIDLDKFTNFFNYYWVAEALDNTPVMEWNPTLAPEFYVIARPKSSAKNKLNVVTSTNAPVVLTGTGFYAQTWTVQFTSSTDFTVTATGAGLPASQVTKTFVLDSVNTEESSVFQVMFTVPGASAPLVQFNIVRDPIYDTDGLWIGNESFTSGDTFQIVAPFISTSYSVTTVNASSGVKGKITNVKALSVYQTINGVQLKENDRILVKDQSLTSENGIYVVKSGSFERAEDYTGSNIVGGALVFDRSNSALFESTAANLWSEVGSESNTNDWQEFNFWIHRDDIAAAGYDLAKVVQATRPIIEFNDNVALNQYYTVGSGVSTLAALSNSVALQTVQPSSSGVKYVQRKSEFNQAPLFDLYFYNGKHTGKVSPVFFYMEDPTADIDSVLQRRVKLASNESNDFLFSHGLVQGDMNLFYKTVDGELHSVWHPGYKQATVTDEVFSGVGNGSFDITINDPFTPQQVWSLTAVTENTFELLGSKNTVIPNDQNIVTVGTEYNTDTFTILITAGSTSFAVGDTLVFTVGNMEVTRYVARDDSENLYDVYGGPEADVNGDGAWQVPRMFYNNVAADISGEIPEGTLYSHFRGILLNQIQDGSLDKAFGGSVKLWSEQQNLLASLLMQRDLTPVSMIEFAQQQYESALMQVQDIYLTSALKYFSNNEVTLSTDQVPALVDYLLSIRKSDNDTKTVLYDSTSGVVGFPITLPMMGVIKAVQPAVGFDNELGIELMTHHDGHKSPLLSFTQQFKDRIVSPGTTVLRADGSYTPAVGSFSTAMPVRPHKGELWFYPVAGTQRVFVFNVLSDLDAPTPTQVGQHWYHRSGNVLYVWDGAEWVIETDWNQAWAEIDLAGVLNSAVLEIENRLFLNCNAEQRVYFDDAALQTVLSDMPDELYKELTSWAAVNGYDPFAPDYTSADPFTWNYRSFGPARWFNALKAHQAQFTGVIPTSRPNVEPWKLAGFASEPSWWNGAYAAEFTPDTLDRTNLVTAKVVVPTSQVSPLSGLYIIDGVTLYNGDTVLLVNESSNLNNGLWIARAGAWERAAVSLDEGLVVQVQEGNAFSGTEWRLAADAVNGTPVIFDTVRYWKQQMWTDIQTAHPGLKLSVDTNRADYLLPPYVSPSKAASANAVFTAIPPSAASSYVFGENSPVETVWIRSIEFGYSLAKALFRKDPLSFLGHCWGFHWIEVDNILYDTVNVSVPGHKRFVLHGEAFTAVQRTSPFNIGFGGGVTGPEDVNLTIVYNGYTSSRQQSFMVKTANGKIIGYLHTGVLNNISHDGYSLTNILIDDEGIPFRVGDTFTLTAESSGAGMAYTFTPATYHQILGFGQTFAQALRASSIDSTQGYAISAFREWDVNLGYRAGGLVSTEDLRVFSDAEALPESAYQLRVTKSPFAKDLWVQGLRISVVQYGSSKPSVSGYVPTNDASDWVFRIDGYNPRYLNVKAFTFDTSASYETFNVLGAEHTALTFKHFTEVNGETSLQLPLTVTGLQNVVNFLFGYYSKLEADGWKFQDENGGTVDARTGRVLNIQFEVEQLIDSVYAGITLGTGQIVNPFVSRVWVDQETGVVSKFFDSQLFDVQAHPAVFDVLGAKIETKDLTILRSGGKAEISATVPMYSAHVQTDEYEHLFIFNNLSSPSTNSGVIYDPFSGARVATMKFNGRKQGVKNLRPEFGGHYLVGNSVKRNFQSGVDKVSKYYDTNHVYEDEQSTKHAMALLGYSPKSYMADLDLNEHSQFNFWRGLVQMKGTNSSIDSFLNNDRFQDAKIDEYWAYKVAEYGDNRQRVFPELKLTVNDTIQQFTKLWFNPTASTNTDLVSFTQINSDDEERWFTLDDLSQDMTFTASSLGTYQNTFTSDTLVKLGFIADKLNISTTGTANVVQVNADTILVSGNGDVTVNGYGPSTDKFNPIKLFNYIDNELVCEIPYWNPAAGFNTPGAMAVINVTSNLDPARYNNSTQVNGNANFDPLRAWGANEVGRVWWDTSNLAYTPYYDAKIYTTLDERLNRWGTLTDFATIDVVEWVESSVPPSEYDSQSAVDAGNADLDTASKADGSPYGAKTYVRDRVWMIRPIAWSQAGVPTQAAHPAFNGYTNDTLNIDVNSGLMYLESKTFSAAGISAGMRIGGWNTESDPVPTSEYKILSFTKYVSGDAGNAISVNKYTALVGTLAFSSSVVQVPITDTNGVQTGTTFESYLTCTEVLSGDTDTVLVRSSTSDSTVLSSGESVELTFTTFGLSVNVTIPAGTYLAGEDVDYICDLFQNVVLHDAANVQAIVADTGTSFSNDDSSTLGWRAWTVPTQAELDADSRVPNSKFFPYFGDYSVIVPTVENIQEAAAEDIMLNDGTSVNRYSTTWTDWTELGAQLAVTWGSLLTANWTVFATSNGARANTSAITTGDISLQVPNVTVDRISVYLNGVAQLAATYTKVGSTLTLLNVPASAVVDVVIRSYTPTADELAFAPDTKDDLKVQQHYKVDYQYVEVPVRGTDGAILSSKYFFWVKNRSTAVKKKDLSVKSITDLLLEGPSQYMTFQNLSTDLQYSAITVAGLNYVVTKDNTFKLRFTRNMTLRDDPNELNLKDVHTEWALIRPGQKTKIPEDLWNKVVNAACGYDAAGNVLPSAARTAYDDRNGTRTRFGFGAEQILAPSDLVKSTLKHTILNTRLVDDSGSTAVPDYMDFLDFNLADEWFSTAEGTRNTLTRVWNEGKVSQINELFFAVLEDILAANYELTDIFKTSRLSAYSIKVVRAAPIVPTYE